MTRHAAHVLSAAPLPPVEPSCVASFDLLPYDALETIVSWVDSDADKQSMRKVCWRMRSAPCLQPSGITIDVAQHPESLGALKNWPKGVPLKSLTLKTSSATGSGLPASMLRLLKAAAGDSAVVEVLHGVRHLTIQAIGEYGSHITGLQEISQLGGLLCSLCPLLERLTLDNVRLEVALLSSLMPLKHFYRFDVGENAVISGFGGVDPADVVRPEVHWDRPCLSDFRWLSKAAHLKHLYVTEVCFDDIPSTLLAFQHPTATLHIKAFKINNLSRCSSWSNAAGLERWLLDHKGSFDWSGTLIVKSKPSAALVQAVQRINDVFDRAGQGIKKLTFGSFSSFFVFSYDDVRSLAQAAPHTVTSLELQKCGMSQFQPHMLMWMLEVWPIQSLTLNKYDESFVQSLRSLRANGKVTLRENVCVKVFPDASTTPRRPQLEFVL